MVLYNVGVAFPNSARCCFKVHIIKNYLVNVMSVSNNKIIYTIKSIHMFFNISLFFYQIPIYVVISVDISDLIHLDIINLHFPLNEIAQLIQGGDLILIVFKLTAVLWFVIPFYVCTK